MWERGKLFAGRKKIKCLFALHFSPPLPPFADTTGVLSVVSCKKAHALDKKAYKKEVLHMGVTSNK